MKTLARLTILVVLAGCADDKLVGTAQPPAEEPPADGGFVPPTHPAPPVGPRIWPPPDREERPNPIPAENSQPGDPTWDDTRDAYARQIEGYADRVSAKAGETVRFMLNSSEHGTATWKLYRFGWYGGDGARLIAAGGPVEIFPQDPCPMDPESGMVRCSWEPTLSIEIEPEWVSGLYALKATRDDGFTRFVPLVILDDRPADLLMQASVTTYQAYNTWGGTSFYYDSTGTLPLGRASKLSFDRPYGGDQGTGQLLRYEIRMARFLERYGYDVTYTTNLDVSWEGWPHLHQRGAFLSVGHDEYWAGEERDAVEAARDAGVPLLFFSANTAYWKVRFEDVAGPRNPRTMVCYKGRTRDDPVQDEGVTGRFRDAPIDRPENGLMGVMYESWLLLSPPFVVSDPNSFLYTGTGLRAGDVLPWLVGYEYDRTISNGATPEGFHVVARSPVVDAEGKPGFSEAGWYRAASDALVFSTGTIEWAYGLDKEGIADPRLARMTANVIEEALGIPVPAGVGEGAVPEPPEAAGPFASSVDTVATGFAGAVSVGVLPDGSLVVADARRHQILRIADGVAEVLAGDGQLSNNPAYDNVPGATARFFYPTALLTDDDGSILVADTYNHVIRKILPDEQRTVITLAGTMGRGGFADGAGADARFSFPMGLAFDPVTSDILVADAANHRIRAIQRGSWQVTTIAGSGGGDADGPGLAARFSYPTAVAASSDGTIYAAATGNAKIVRIAPDASRTVTTLAGGRPGWLDGNGATALLAPQGGLIWDGAGLLISEPANYRIRRLLPGEDASSTEVSTFAGSGRFGSTDGPGESAEIPLPLGLAQGPDGTIYAVDGGNRAIRAITP